MKVIGATLGNCVHNAGILRFLEKARELGHETVFAGVGLRPPEIAALAASGEPVLVALSYRLTPEVARELFRQLAGELARTGSGRAVFAFGGTGSVCRVARDFPLFRFVVSGPGGMVPVVDFLAGGPSGPGPSGTPADRLDRRIEEASPRPLFRHHFGRPTLSSTLAGARRIALSGEVDILSIGPDQNAQEFFFEPEKMDPSLDGAGGVPLRSRRDLEAIRSATRRGNFPLLRCYSGTGSLLRWAEMLVDTIDICFGAVPLTFYSEIDGRSRRRLAEAIEENQAAIAWYASRGIPVEVNESHQWALRGASPAVEIAAAVLAARNAAKLGVTDYIQQYMFNVPREITPFEDLAKMLAKREMVEELAGPSFTVRRMVRTGLDSLPSDSGRARGHIASTLTIAMFLEPQVVHVVGFSEADHVIGAAELVESVRIARGAVENCLSGLPDIREIPGVAARASELRTEAGECLARIESLGDTCRPGTIVRAVEAGILAAPQLLRPAGGRARIAEPPGEEGRSRDGQGKEPEAKGR